MFYRLRWALRQFCDYSSYQEQKRMLDSPATFYAAIATKLLPRSSTREILLRLRDGHVIPIRHFMTLYIFCEIFVEKCYDVPIDGKAPVILDVGANTGLFALRMKQRFPDAIVNCYEPFPGNFDQLERTIDINRLTDVRMVKKAVGGHARESRLHIHQHNVGGHSLAEALVPGKDRINVDVISLSQILKSTPAKVALMKLDCEGSEFEILMSMTKGDAERIKKIIVEMNPVLYDPVEVFSHMRSLGYERDEYCGLPLFVHRS